jgi:phosphatidylserine decarboxylase
VSPADGRIEELGYANGDQLIQAKRFRYRLADFLATDDAAVTRFHDGATLTIYLAPHNYHRVHMPLPGQVREVVHVPGRRWAVNQRTARAVPGLFAANERVILWCENPAGRFAVVLVGAMNVASISLAWTGEIAQAKEITRIRYPADAPHLAIPAGGLLGQFNLGSTVVVVAEKGLISWDAGNIAGRSVRMGEGLGQSRPG